MLKLAKDSEDVIRINSSGDIIFSGYYQEDSLGVTLPGELQISKGGDPKFDTAESTCDRDVRLKNDLFEKSVPPLNFSSR